MLNTNKKEYLLFFVSLISILAIFIFPAIKQPLNYHNFADTREFLGIRNCLNVISNLAFIISGIFGIIALSAKINQKNYDMNEHLEYLAFFISSILVGLGSSYYHLNPNNTTLFWDRLPMSILIMSIFSAIFYEFVSKKLRSIRFFAMLLIGVLSVIHWEFSEIIGHGDVRFYVWAQTYPFIMVILVLLLYKSKYTNLNLLTIAILSYLFAKIAELFDEKIYILTMHFISGHTIKHLADATSIFFIAKYLLIRHPKARFRINTKNTV